jgi:hypothetical protein
MIISSTIKLKNGGNNGIFKLKLSLNYKKFTWKKAEKNKKIYKRAIVIIGESYGRKRILF